MKKCTKCQILQSEENFHKNHTRGDGLRAVCRSCAKILQIEYRKKNKEKCNTRSRNWARENKPKVKDMNKRNHAKIFANLQKVKSDFLDTHPCEVCGERRHPCLDFHHIDPKEKEKNVSKFRTVATFKREADKCIVLCANCHRMVHA